MFFFFFDFDVCVWEERADFCLVRLFVVDFSSHRRASTGYHVACVSNLSKTENTSWTAKLQHGPNFRKESTLAQTGGTCGEKTRT